jgi:hypothetical protein
MHGGLNCYQNVAATLDEMGANWESVVEGLVQNSTSQAIRVAAVRIGIPS